MPSKRPDGNLRRALSKAHHHSEGQWVAYCTQPEFLALVVAGAGPQTALSCHDKEFAKAFGEAEQALLAKKVRHFAMDVVRAKLYCAGGHISQTHHYFYPSLELLKLLQEK